MNDSLVDTSTNLPWTLVDPGTFFVDLHGKIPDDSRSPVASGCTHTSWPTFS